MGTGGDETTKRRSERGGLTGLAGFEAGKGGKKGGNCEKPLETRGNSLDFQGQKNGVPGGGRTHNL